jgi:2-keto-4-pentenoate hydratase
MENKIKRSGRTMYEEFQNKIPFSMLEENRPNDILEAYAIQNEYMNLRVKNNSDSFSGYKIAFTTDVMQKRFGMDQPAYARILTSNVFESPHYFNSADFGRLGVECEIAITIGKDISLKSDEINKNIVFDSVESVALSFEIIDPGQNKIESLSVFDIIATNIAGAGVLRGNQIKNWQNIDIPNSKCQLMIDGQTIGTGYGKDVDGHPVLPIIWLAKKLSDQGSYLKAGDIVVTGSMIAPTFLGNKDATGASSAILEMDNFGPVILNFN